MPNRYHRRDDVDVEGVPSPLDPWGMLTLQEKARAAILHAELVRNPPEPYVHPERVFVPEPERPVPRPPSPSRTQSLSQARGAAIVGQCAFAYGVEQERDFHLPITHAISRSSLHPVGSHVCMACAEAIMRPSYDHHAVHVLRPRLAPNSRRITLLDGLTIRSWDSTVPGIIITENDTGRSYELRHEASATILCDGCRYGRMNNAVRVARALQHMCDWTESVIPEHASESRRRPVIAGVMLDTRS